MSLAVQVGLAVRVKVVLVRTTLAVDVASVVAVGRLESIEE